MSGKPSEGEIKEVFKIARDATAEKRPQKIQSEFERWLDSTCESLLSHQWIGFSISIILAVISSTTHDVAWSWTALVTFTLSQLIGTALSIAVIAYSLPFVYRLYKEPSSQFMTLVESSWSLNSKHVEKLTQCNVMAIRYVLSHYETERQAFEKRCGILIGSVEKVGFFPALAGLVALSANLSKFHVLQSTANTFIGLFLAFYILGIGAFTLMQRQDRVIAILKLSLEVTK